MRSVEMRSTLRCPHDYHAWTERECVFGVEKTPRVIDLLDVAFWAYRLQSSEVHDKRGSPVNWFCDLTSQVRDRPWGSDPLQMLSSTSLYSYALKSVVSLEVFSLSVL